MGRPRIEHRHVDGVELKRCCACKEWLDLASYNRNASCRDGLQSTCRTCGNAATAASNAKSIDARRAYSRRYSIENRERLTASRTQWRRDNPEREAETRRRYRENNPERVAELDRAKRIRNRDAIAVTNRQQYEKNRAARIEQACQWVRDNPEQAARNSARARARRRARERDLPSDGWTEEELIARDGLVCWMCKVPLGGLPFAGRRDWAVDHLIPIACDYPDHPGDTLANVAIACHPCNVSKNARLLPAAIARYEQNARLAAS